MVDLRRFPRVPLHTPLEFSLSAETSSRRRGKARDISVGGMFIEADDPPSAVGQGLTVYLTLSNRPEMALPAVVRWSDGAGMGVQFGLLGARETHEITELASAHRRSSSG